MIFESPKLAKPVSVKLEDDDHERLASLAAAKRRTPHCLMREAITEYLAREEKLLAFHAEAEAAWTDYTETGLHLSLADMQVWAKKPGAPLPPWRNSSSYR